MQVGRNGETPEIAAEARIASSAAIVGNVRIGAGCYIDHGVVIESGGLPIVIGDETIIFAGAVLRSVGGGSRPRFEVELGKRTLVSPHCVLTGCRIGSHCYIATGRSPFRARSWGITSASESGHSSTAGQSFPIGPGLGCVTSPSRAPTGSSPPATSNRFVSTNR